MKKLLILTALASVLVLQGCMKIETTANINEAGKANMTMTVDLSQIAAMSESMMSGATTETSKPQDFCTENEMSEQAFKKYQNVTCKSISEYVSVMTYTTDMSKNIKKSNATGEYLINIQKLLKDSQESVNQETSSSQTEEEKQNSLDMATSMGFVMNMTINFSGDIISSDVGTIKGNTLTIDLLTEGDKIAQKKDVRVKIKKSNAAPMSAGELQKIKYEKLLNALQKRLQKIDAKGVEKADKMIASSNQEILKKLLENTQKAKRKTSMVKYMEAKIRLQLNK